MFHEPDLIKRHKDFLPGPDNSRPICKCILVRCEHQMCSAARSARGSQMRNNDALPVNDVIKCACASLSSRCVSVFPLLRQCVCPCSGVTIGKQGMRARTGPGQSGARPSVFEMFHLRCVFRCRPRVVMPSLVSSSHVRVRVVPQ